jgi:hypothetical protein
MPSQTIPGSCLCGAVKFEIDPPLAAFRYCHCGRCRKASGSAHAANAFVPSDQFRWLTGEALVKRFDLPGAKRFAVNFCTRSRVPHEASKTSHVLIPAGVLEGDPGKRPEMSIFWASRAPWYVAPGDLPLHDERT